MRLLSFAGAPLYAMLLVTSATGAPTNEGMIANDHLSKLPPEVLLNCLSYFSWEERADLRLINKKLGNLLSDDQNIATLSNLKKVVELIFWRPPEEAQAMLGPYWTRPVNMLSSLQPENFALLSQLDPKVRQDQLPFLSMVVDSHPHGKYSSDMITLVSKVLERAFQGSFSFLAQTAIRHWAWQDILKAAVFYNRPEATRDAIVHTMDFHTKWYRETYMVYIHAFRTIGDPDWSFATMQTFKSELTINSYLDPPEARAEIEPASFEFRLWQRAHFWTWAIALGHDEVRDVLEPKHSKWTTDHYKRLTTIMCQLQVAKVCDYLTHVKGYNYSPDDNINFDQMTFAQKLRELPNPYLNWDISDPQKVWVAAPEESAPMPQ